VLGGIAGAAVLYLIASGKAGFSVSAGFASNGYGAHSPGGYSLAAGFLCEAVMTFMFLVIIYEFGTFYKVVGKSTFYEPIKNTQSIPFSALPPGRLSASPPPGSG